MRYYGDISTRDNSMALNLPEYSLKVQEVDRTGNRQCQLRYHSVVAIL